MPLFQLIFRVSYKYATIEIIYIYFWMKATSIAKIQLTLQGLMNHFGFFLLLSSSESIAIGFNKKNLVSVLSMLATVTGILMIILNISCLINYSAQKRIIWNGIIMAAGYAIIGVGWFFDFYIVMAGSLIPYKLLLTSIMTNFQNFLG